MPLQPMNRMTTSQTITEYFAEKIRRGEYQAGDRLPSERELMAQLSVARSTIREAMQSLYSRNLIEIRAGEGTFVKEYGVEETLLAQLQVLLSEETEMEHLVAAQKLLNTLTHPPLALKEDTMADRNGLLGSEVNLSGSVLPQNNKTLDVLSKLVSEVIDYRQSMR